MPGINGRCWGFGILLEGLRWLRQRLGVASGQTVGAGAGMDLAEIEVEFR